MSITVARKSRSRRPRRVGRPAVLGLILAGLVALPAGAQETSEPTPSPSPSPTTSAPAPPSPPPPSPAPSGATIEATRKVKPDRPAKRKKRHRRKTRYARGAEAKAACQPFTYTQTYITWGPALAYGEPVTVAYRASRCTKPTGTALELTMQGTAKVYQGILAEGTPIDTRGFSVMGLWDRPEDPAGWPPSWWSCDVKLARYTWEIDGMYRFAVTARWGVWSLEVSNQGASARTVRWTHNGCS